MRHIIVEGPDGSGKGNLIRDLTNHLGLPVHPRFVQSTGGPPEDLWDRMMDDIATPAFSDMHHTWIYDRHPLISEPIYGPIVRGKAIGSFAYPSWVDRMRARVAERCLVVFCIPPYVEVLNNVVNPRDNIEHMDGVAANVHAIYTEYAKRYKEWPGPYLRHDYVMNPPGSHNRGVLIGRIRRMAQEGEREWRTNPR
jgi:hypothetical protein